MENQENQLNWGWDNTSEEQSIDWGNQENQNNEWGNIEGDNQDPYQDNEFIWEQNNQGDNENQDMHTLDWEDKGGFTINTPNKSFDPNQSIVEDTSLKPSTSNNEFLTNSDSEFEKYFKFIGTTNELYYHGDLFTIELDNSKILEDINNLNLETSNDNGRYKFNPSENSELGKLIHILVKIGIKNNTKIIDSSIIKTKNNESFLNINKAKPRFNFIYFAQSNETSGDIIIDFSPIGGPSYSIIKPSQSQLLLLPGWIPYRISKNNSNEDNILITGMYD